MKVKEKEISKIGFYLAYPPKKIRTSLKQEGLGRYLTMLLKALIKEGYNITIACPSWNVYMVEELLEDVGADGKNIEYVTTSKEPIALRLYYWLCNREKRTKNRKRRIISATINVGRQILDVILMIRNLFVFSLLVIVLLILGIAFLPVGLVVSIIASIARGINKIYKKLVGKTQNVVKKKARTSFLYNVKEYIFGIYIPLYIDRVRYSYAKDVVHKINCMEKQADIWYCPTAFWEEFNLIKCKKVVCAPDLVTTEFPISFCHKNVACATNQVREALKNGEYFITYCDYVKKTLLVDKLNKSVDDVMVIPHGVNDCNKYIDLRQCFNRPGFSGDYNLKFSRELLQGLITKIVSNKDQYVYSDTSIIDMHSIEYIFYASQTRGNKNMINLVKAYEKLLREKGVCFKLILTCNYNENDELKNYIYQHRLQYDVLSFYSVTNQELAAMYKCAKLCVNPTFYEGGFPFTFGEGMSVGTPSVMSKIPQVLEEVDADEWRNMLFDPYDVNDMVEKIYYCYHHIDEIYNIEKKTFDRMNARSWEEVAHEYVEAFEYFAKK